MEQHFHNYHHDSAAWHQGDAAGGARGGRGVGGAEDERDGEDDITWSPAAGRAEPNAFNDMMVRLAMPMQEDWAWQFPITHGALQEQFVSQAHCGADPAQGDAEVAHNSPGAAGMIWPLQFYVNEHQQRLSHPNQYGSNRVSRPGFERSISRASQQHYTSAAHSSSETRSVDSICSQPLQPPLAIPWPDVFASTRNPHADPTFEAEEGQQPPQRKAKRSAEDLYTPRWVRNHGTQREGWCGWCCTWYTLRDSTYWYHMHYSHGISQVDGKRLPAPAGFRTFCESAEWEVKCGKCTKWMPLPPGDRWNTAYFRHTYKCYFKTGAKADDSGPSSPMRPSLSTARRSLSNML